MPSALAGRLCVALDEAGVPGAERAGAARVRILETFESRAGPLPWFGFIGSQAEVGLRPDPEIDPKVGDQYSRIFATGRSDFPNQINNALAFPGIFRGALDVQAREINEAMKLAAAQAIADVVPESALSEDYVIPSLFDKEVVPRVAKAVAGAARETGVARRKAKVGDDPARNEPV